MAIEGEQNTNATSTTAATTTEAITMEELETSNHNNRINRLSSLKEGNTSFFKTFFNAANTILGNGVIIVPYALASGGWLSLIVFFTISILVTYTGLLVKRCMEVDPNIKRYSDIGDRSYGKIGRIIVTIALYADLYMATTGFLILEGDNFHKLFPKFAIHAPGISINGKSSFIILIAFVLFPTVLFDNLSILAYISATGCLAALVILGSVFCVGAFEGVGFQQAAQSGTALLNWKGIPTAVSLYMLCYASHPVFPTLYTSMKKKRHFFKVLLLSFAFSSFVYGSMAILGYLMFGSKVQSQITLNLPTQKIASKVAIYTTVINPLAKYALLLKPVVITTEGWFPSEYMEKKFFRFVVRAVLVVTQVIVALALPYFGYLMALAGALFCSTGTLLIPSVCYLKISRTNRSNQKLIERIFIWGIVGISIAILVSGTYTSLVNIVEEVMHKHK